MKYENVFSLLEEITNKYSEKVSLGIKSRYGWSEVTYRGLGLLSRRLASLQSSWQSSMPSSSAYLAVAYPLALALLQSSLSTHSRMSSSMATSYSAKTISN
jgi:hypothetical protein